MAGGSVELKVKLNDVDNLLATKVITCATQNCENNLINSEHTCQWSCRLKFIEINEHGGCMSFKKKE